MYSYKKEEIYIDK